MKKNEKKLILIVENSIKEQEEAKKILLKHDCLPVVAANLEDGLRLLKEFKYRLFGVITSLHYGQRVCDSQNNQPNGLAMVTACMNSNVRVAICSNIDSQQSAYLDSFVEMIFDCRKNHFLDIPVCKDFKDWEKVLKKLLKLK